MASVDLINIIILEVWEHVETIYSAYAVIMININWIMKIPAEFSRSFFSFWLHHDNDVRDGGCQHGREGSFVHLKVAHAVYEAATLELLDHAYTKWRWLDNGFWFEC